MLFLEFLLLPVIKESLAPSPLAILCEQNAPFETKDGPYLECHHVITIAEGGPDVIYNTVALCPNCHRKINRLKDSKDLKKLTDVIYKY